MLLTVHAGGRYPSQRLPKVKFINGRELLVCPEKFSADYSQLGVCTRVQVCMPCAYDMLQCPLWDVTCWTYRG